MTELRNSVPYSVHFLQAEFRNFAEMTWQAEFRVFRNDGIPFENLINDYIFGLTIVFFIQFSKILHFFRERWKLHLNSQLQKKISLVCVICCNL